MRPWITGAILKSVKRKNRLYKQKIKNPTEKNIRRYTEYRNRLNHLIRYSKKKYFKSLLEKSQGNLHATWNAINVILNKRKSKKSDVSFLQHNGRCYKDGNSIASLFNDFFTNVGPSLAKKLPRSKKSFKHWLNTVSNCKFILQPVSEFAVLDLIYQLKSSKSIGFKDLNTKHIQSIAEYIYQPLCYLFNTSILIGKFPDRMKIAKVIPLFKAGCKSIVSNYRPISLLSDFSKLLEKIVCNQLVCYLEENNLLYTYQFGFRKKRNTSLAIVDFINKINQAIDSGEISIGVFLDLSKAFDTVDHDILLEKLFCYGIHGKEHNWFKKVSLG